MCWLYRFDLLRIVTPLLWLLNSIKSLELLNEDKQFPEAFVGFCVLVDLSELESVSQIILEIFEFVYHLSRFRFDCKVGEWTDLFSHFHSLRWFLCAESQFGVF